MFGQSNHDSHTNFFGLALAKGFIVSGLVTLAGAVLQVALAIPAVWVIGVGLLAGGVLFLRDFLHIAAWLEFVWKERQRAEAAELGYKARLFAGGGGGDEADSLTPPAQPPDHPVTVKRPEGAYTLPGLTPEEKREMDEIGLCIKFLAIANVAQSFSVRDMYAKASPQFTEAQFKTWWTARTDQLVAWGLFEKQERGGTRPTGNRSITSVRSALLRRDFRRTLPPARETDSQTDSQTGLVESGAGA